MATLNKNRLKRLESKVNDSSMSFTEAENKLCHDIIERYSHEDLLISCEITCSALNDYIHDKYIFDNEREAYKKYKIKEQKIHESNKSKNNDEIDKALKGMFDSPEEKELILKIIEIEKALILEYSGELLELYKQGKIKELYALKDKLFKLAEEKAKLI